MNEYQAFDPTLYLEHYGVLGMKWGVRRTPEQLGHHKIPKGTKMYRVTTESRSLLGAGSTYVTYLPPDRDLYRGSYSQTLKKNQGGKENEKMVESEYESTVELNIPSREELRKAYQKAMANDKLKKEACKAIAEHIIESEEIYYYENYGERNYKKQMSKGIKDYTKNMVDNFGNYTPDEAFTWTARSLGSASPIVKQAVIDQLKSKGYNAMVDEAGVGGMVTPREGVEPLIIFDGNSSLKKINQQDISTESMIEANKRYTQWSRVANRNIRKPW